MRQISRHFRWPLGAAISLGCTTEEAPPFTCAEAPGTICTVAGSGIAGLGHDGELPTSVPLYLPQDVTVGDDGRLYIADWNNHRIRVIDNGVVETLVGTGYLGDAPDGPALGASLNHPTHVAFAPDGKLIVSAWHNSKVLELDLQSNQLRTICGNGLRSWGGDGGPAAKALLDLPVAVDFDSKGRMVISDQANQRIRRIESDGTINTIAGPPSDYIPPGFERVVPEGKPAKFCRVPDDPAAPTPEESRLANGDVNPACLSVGVYPQGFGGDGGPAVGAFMSQSSGQQAPPSGRLEIGSDDTVYFTDTFNHRVRAVSPDGMIRTFAGSGPADYDPNYAGGYAGDGGPADQALLKGPVDVAVAQDDTLYIADTQNSCVRVVRGGTIDTYAGQCGKRSFGGDGGAPTAALLNRPYGVALDSAGNLYIADTHNHRVRIVYAAAD